MKRIIKLEIDCSDTTCSSAPSAYCRMLASGYKDWRCNAFNIPLKVELHSRFSSVLRCDECLQAEVHIESKDTPISVHDLILNEETP
jgi:hypothetical protein